MILTTTARPTAFRRLSRAGRTVEYTQASQAELFDQFETGHISPAEFRAGLRAAYDLEATDAQIDAAWHALLLDVPAERLALLGELRRAGPRQRPCSPIPTRCTLPK
ncbi:MAG: hypothetical protein WKG07_32585 [Hymenobacter sp.]